MSAQSPALPKPKASKGLRGISFPKAGEIGIPIAVLAIVIALITPMPPFLLDILIVLDIAMSVVVLMVTMYIIKPVDFSVFPTTF